MIAIAAHTDESHAPHTTPMPCSNMAELEGITSCDQETRPGVSPQEPDEPLFPRPKLSPLLKVRPCQMNRVNRVKQPILYFLTEIRIAVRVRPADTT